MKIKEITTNLQSKSKLSTKECLMLKGGNNKNNHGDDKRKKTLSSGNDEVSTLNAEF